MKTRKYYIAKVRLRQMKAFNGDIITEEDEEAYLSEDEGYYALGSPPKEFTSIKFIKDNAYAWDGMPWYKRMKPETLRIFEVTEEHHFERKEKEVFDGKKN